MGAALSIIGTAGRGATAQKLDTALYLAAYHLLDAHLGDSSPLVSGGAAWMDHLAVALFLADSSRGLRLYLPAAWDRARVRFEDTGVRDWRTNPGGTANYYHYAFSRRLTGRQNPLASLQGIQRAMDAGAEVHIVPGFYQRNEPVAKSPRLAALTFGAGRPADGGTKHTWDRASGAKVHVDLGLLARVGALNYPWEAPWG